MKKVKLELTPYNALAILAFLREFINDDNNDDYQFKAIHDATNEYEQEVSKKISTSQIDDALAENDVNKLIGKWPHQF